jgi:protein-tyrosine phosphatase
MAEALARTRAAELGLTEIAFESAGTAALHGFPASDPALRVAAGHGIALDAHRSRPLTADLVDSADLVIAMTERHGAASTGLAPGAPVILATSLLPDGHPARGRDLLDPFGGDERIYEASWDVIAECVDALLDRIARERSG